MVVYRLGSGALFFFLAIAVTLITKRARTLLHARVTVATSHHRSFYPLKRAIILS